MDVNHIVLIDDQGAHIERMRADRRDEERLDRRIHDRAAGRKGIRRRTGRRSDDDAIRLVVHEMRLIDGKAEAQHARHAAFRHHNVVDGMPEEALSSLAPHESCEQEALLDVIAADEDLFQPVLELVELDIRHEAQCADVDAADGHLPTTVAMADAEQRPIPAEGERHVHGLLLDVFHAVGFCAAEKPRFLHRQDQLYIALSKEAEDPVEHVTGIRLIDIREYGNPHPIHARLPLS